MKFRKFIYKILLLIALFVVGCRLSTDGIDDTGNVLYSNSFETAADTAGWWGWGTYNFRSDVPPKGGNQSLFVSGGCLFPHAIVTLNPPGESKLILKSWGKNLGNGGAVELQVGKAGTYPAETIHIIVRDSAWTNYQSADTLYCPADSVLTLSFFSGGIVASAMLVDLMQIIRVE